jgi:type VI protein secretion system component VasK
MEQPKFRKLHIWLPSQRLVKQRPWFIAGLLLVLIVLLIAVYSYFANKKNATSVGQQRKVVLLVNFVQLEKLGRFSPY